MSSPGYWYPLPRPRLPSTPPPFVPPKDDLAIHQYNDLRSNAHDLEELIGSIEEEPGWTEKDRKRLDKAMTVMKVGFKLLKKVLKARARRRDNDHHHGSSTTIPG